MWWGPPGTAAPWEGSSACVLGVQYNAGAQKDVASGAVVLSTFVRTDFIIQGSIHSFISCISVKSFLVS